MGLCSVDCVADGSDFVGQIKLLPRPSERKGWKLESTFPAFAMHNFVNLTKLTCNKPHLCD